MTAKLKVVFLSTVFILAIPFSQQQTNKRITIFDDEKLEGGSFEKADYFNSITLDSVSPYRLPTTTRPVYYDLLWTVNITDLSFSGEVDIYLHATQPNVNEIVLHAYDLNITSLELSQEDEAVYQTYTLQPAYHFLRVLLTSGTLAYNETDPVTYKLSIGFNAPLRTDMNGLYRSWFRTETNEVSWMATTFFAPTGARLAFPCYDEPSFKAKFQVTIRRPIEYKSWACTRKQETRNITDTGFQDDVFYPTPIMSTYILAIVVAQYESTEPEDNGKVMHEVILRPYDLNTQQGDYAQDVGIKLLDAMSVHTGIDYYSVDSEIKMSHVAIPDFSAGAMENWGLVSYREAFLLYDENQTSSHNKQRTASLLAHEIAHMWFGNLVTCDWWGVTWLNEGFGRYYEYYLTDMVKAFMEFPTRFVPEQVHTSLLSDASDNPHPLTNPNVGSPDAAWAMFSTITYNKGASVIRMTEHLLGSEVHKEGIRRYLKKRYLDTALPIHLFESLQEVAEEFDAISIYGADFNVIDYYKTWTEQAGHPLLRIYINHSTGEMTIYQGRFNINTGYSTASTNWIIPINFATASNADFNDTKPSHIIRDSVTIINRTTIGDQWTIFNKQQTGFYRVHYDDYTWKLITMALKSPERTNIHELNRAQIVDDVFQFARSGIMNYTEALNVLSFLRYETDYAPWAAAIASFNWLSNRFVGTALETRLNELFMDWASNVMDELTFNSIDEEPFLRSHLRFQLAPVMCRLGYEPCREEARKQFDELKFNNTEVPADHRNWVYCNGLRYGELEDFELLWERYLTHEVHNEKTQILTTLGCTPIEDALHQFLDAIIDPDYTSVIRPQDYTSAFNSAVTGNRNNTQIVFRYIQNNFQAVVDAFGSATTPLSYISSRLRTVEEVEQFRVWAVSQQGVLGTSFQTIYSSTQTALNALQWAQEMEEDINYYLDNGDEPFQPSTAATLQTTTSSTVTVPPLIELTTPFLDDSANIVNLSFTLIALNILVYFL